MKIVKRTVWGALKGTGAGILVLLAYLGYIHFNGNFHTVLEGELYRSAQVTPETLTRYARENGIRSVLNLRGAAPGSDWYEAEIASSRELGLTHADFGLVGHVEISQDQAEQLIALMERLPKPLLIHCKQGSDRTGFVVALYLAAIEGVGEEEAEGALSLTYGHFSVPYLSATYAMDVSWENLEGWLGFVDS